MIRRDRVRTSLKVLRDALADLDRYRATITREKFDDDRDARFLVEYAVQRALTGALDVGKEWASTRKYEEGPARYEDGLWRMEEDGLVVGLLGSRLRDSIQLRNDLAHGSPTLDDDKVFATFQSAEFLGEFVDVVEKFLDGPLEKVRQDEVLTGVVTYLNDRKAVVDLGGIEGTIHVSQMARGWVAEPSDLLKQGEEVQVRVTSFDLTASPERIDLALEPLRRSPWHDADEKYRVRSRVRGTVVRIVDWQGVYVRLEPGVEAFVPVAEMSWAEPFWHPGELVSYGEEIEAIVLEIRARSGHIKLGMKQLMPRPEVGANEENGS